MCVLKCYSDSRSFSAFAAATEIPVYSVHDKGSPISGSKVRTRAHHQISFDVSDKKWSDFPGQVKDAIAFLAKWETPLRSLIEEYRPDDAFLDFPLYSRLDERIVNQNEHLPRELIALAGRIGLGIEMSLYSNSGILASDGEEE